MADRVRRRAAHARKRLAVLLAAGLVAACSGGSGEPAALEIPVPRTVLVVGNSFLRVEGGLDVHLLALARSMRPPREISVQRISQDGATLAVLRQDPAVAEAIRSGAHQAVVLQDDIPEYGGPDAEPFKAAVRAFNQEISARGGRPVLFMAWAYPRLDWISQAGIAAAHRTIAHELGLPVVPVGLAFEAAWAERPALPMLGDDDEHESLHGMYLAACVTYASLFHESPEGASYVPAGITADEAAFLQGIARRTVAAWNGAR